LTYTILGADGFVGTALTDHLEAEGEVVQAARRSVAPRAPLGHVIDCAGLTADFRSRPLDTMEAHVGRVIDILRAGGFESYLYLSSTRVYQHCEHAHEDVPIPVFPSRPDDLYAISKLAGEAVCLVDSRPTVRVVRLSNVVGLGADPTTFLASVIRDARSRGDVELHVDPRSSRDFVSLADVVRILPEVSTRGQHRLYNVAAGENRSAGEVLDEVCRLTGARWRAAPAPGQLVTFPEIDARRLREEFAFTPARFEDVLAELVATEGSQR
jgi:nucleoside-diphosphate-sugar epimerase